MVIAIHEVVIWRKKGSLLDDQSLVKAQRYARSTGYLMVEAATMG